MRKIRHGQILALLLAGLLACPAALLAESFACFHKAHHCAPAPATLITCCCISAADRPQPSLTVSVIAAYGAAAARGAVRDLTAMVADVVALRAVEPPSRPPVDRLALSGQLLI
jgi:hypothetical protein